MSESEVKDGIDQAERVEPIAGKAAAPAGAIKLRAGDLPAAVDAAEAALIAAGPGPVFQRGGMLVHVVDRPARRSDGTVERQVGVAPLEQAAFREILGRRATFARWDGRAKAWCAIDPPRPLAEAFYGRGRWDLPDLTQIIDAPTLRADGSLIASPGYDGQTGLLLPAALPGLRVPDEPSARQAEAANDRLIEVLRDFPYRDPETRPGLSLAVALAGLLGALIRPTVPACPLIGVTAPTRGTGKTYLIDLVATIATGRPAVAVATGVGREEFDKAVGAEFLTARSLLLLDNLVQPLGGQLLNMAITGKSVSVRLLGLSKTVLLPMTPALFATGNNLRIVGDVVRRALVCRLDARLEHPEERHFESDLLEEARHRRAEFISAALTLLRWWAVRRDPLPPDGRAFAGFETWCARVRDPLVALGHPDPVEALDVSRAADLDEAKFAAVLEAWRAAWQDEALTVADALHRIERGAGKEVAGALAEALGRGAENAQSVGKYLANRSGKIVDGLCIQPDGRRQKALLWRVVPADDTTVS